MKPTGMMTAAAALMLVLGAGIATAQPGWSRGPWREAPRAEAPTPRMDPQQMRRGEAMRPEMRQGQRAEPRGTPRGLTADERTERRETVFGAMDADSDGLVTREEFMAVRMGPQWEGPRAEAMQARKAERFDAMDADGKGAITLETFRDHAHDRMAAGGSNRPDDRPMRPRR